MEFGTREWLRSLTRTELENLAFNVLQDIERYQQRPFFIWAEFMNMDDQPRRPYEVTRTTRLESLRELIAATVNVDPETVTMLFPWHGHWITPNETSVTIEDMIVRQNSGFRVIVDPLPEPEPEPASRSAP
jgi:hypothetical protein